MLDNGWFVGHAGGRSRPPLPGRSRGVSVSRHRARLGLGRPPSAGTAAAIYNNDIMNQPGLLREGRETLPARLPSTPWLWEPGWEPWPPLASLQQVHIPFVLGAPALNTSFKAGGEQELGGVEQETGFETGFITQSVGPQSGSCWKPLNVPTAGRALWGAAGLTPNGEPPRLEAPSPHPTDSR